MSEIIYKGHRKGYAIVYRTVAQDTRLSLRTRGLFLLMQSLPEDWIYTVAGLAKVAGTGKDQVRAGLKELMETGYLIKEQAHDDGGKFAGNVYVLQEESPLSENPTTVEKTASPLSEKPSTGKPSTVFPTVQNNNIQSNNIHNPPIAPKGADLWLLFDRFWRAYPKKKGKESARRAWRKLAPDMALCRVMAKALDRQRQSGDWQREGGQFIPYPATWLNGRRWEDEEDKPDVSTGGEEGVTYI